MINRPIAAVLIGIGCTVAGGWLTFQTGLATMNIRVTALEQYRETHRAESVHRSEFEKLDSQAVRRDEFQQFMARVLAELADIKQEVRRR